MQVRSPYLSPYEVEGLCDSHEATQPSLHSALSVKVHRRRVRWCSDDDRSGGCERGQMLVLIFLEPFELVDRIDPSLFIVTGLRRDQFIDGSIDLSRIVDQTINGIDHIDR